MPQTYRSVLDIGNAGHLLFLISVILCHVGSNQGQSCGPRVNARLFGGIPCDMQRSAFCTAPGSAYPWNSLRRYIYENQGLMKRMYGDERHSSILQDDVTRRSYSAWNHNKVRTGRVAAPTPETVAMLDEPIGTESSNVSNHTEELSWLQTTTDYTTTVTDDSSTIETSEPEATSSTLPDTTVPVTESEYQDDYDSSPFQQESVTAKLSSTTESISTTLTEPSVTAESYEKIFYSGQAMEESHVINSNSVEEHSKKEEEVVEEKKPVKGFNACPVKEEVIAPYWANNTRGETLALLNVYPFEQYVHWEKCSYENHQMFCREGCRCEQQFRLHRLLAFDPRNECRGIFADWFRFPSCCICVCYNPGSYPLN